MIEWIFITPDEKLVPRAHRKRKHTDDVHGEGAPKKRPKFKCHCFKAVWILWISLTSWLEIQNETWTYWNLNMLNEWTKSYYITSQTNCYSSIIWMHQYNKFICYRHTSHIFKIAFLWRLRLAEREIGITLSGICLSIRLSVCLVVTLYYQSYHRRHVFHAHSGFCVTDKTS